MPVLLPRTFGHDIKPAKNKAKNGCQKANAMGGYKCKHAVTWNNGWTICNTLALSLADHALRRTAIRYLLTFISPHAIEFLAEGALGVINTSVDVNYWKNDTWQNNGMIKTFPQNRYYPRPAPRISSFVEKPLGDQCCNHILH